MDKNTEITKQQYREQYYANHGVYPPEEKGCLGVLIGLVFKGFYYVTIFPIIWCCKWIFKGLVYGFNSTIIETVSKNTEVKILEETEDGKWAKIKYNGKTGYVALEYLTKETGQENGLDQN